MATHTSESPGTTSFDLVLPADPDLLRVVRLLASGLASYTPLDIDSVEGVRVAADELVSTLIQCSDGQPVSVHFAVEGDGVTISATTPVGGEFELDPLTDRILAEVATSHEFRHEGGTVSGHITVRPA